MVVLSVIAAAGIAAACHGMFHRNSAIFGRVLGRLPTREREIALTFDDGPNPAATTAILDVLRAEGVPATFFMLGRHVERWPELASRAAQDGHRIGNHGYHHRRLHLRGPRYVRLDLQMGTDAIQRATGVTPSLFRAPHGYRNPWVSSIANELGQRTVGWTLGVWDSDCLGPDVIAQRAISGVRPGAIVLLHDGDGYDENGDRMQTAEALPVVIRELRAAGYRFVALPS